MGRGDEPLGQSLDAMLQELLHLVQVEVSSSSEVTHVIAALHLVASLLHGSSLEDCDGKFGVLVERHENDFNISKPLTNVVVPHRFTACRPSG